MGVNPSPLWSGEFWWGEHLAPALQRYIYGQNVYHIPPLLMGPVEDNYLLLLLANGVAP